MPRVAALRRGHMPQGKVPSVKELARCSGRGIDLPRLNTDPHLPPAAKLGKCYTDYPARYYHDSTARHLLQLRE